MKQLADPMSDPNWASDATYAGWDLDINADGKRDYVVEYAVDPDTQQLAGFMYRTGSGSKIADGCDEPAVGFSPDAGYSVQISPRCGQPRLVLLKDTRGMIAVAAGDLGAPAAKKYDIEVWLPSEDRYRELTSCSNYTDYSARRLGARMKGGSGPSLVHTLNGTACAVGRTLLFLLEHYQDEGGALAVPDVLRPWTTFTRVERAE